MTLENTTGMNVVEFTGFQSLENFEHHFVGVNKMVCSVNRSAAKMEGQFPSKSALNLRPSHSAKKNGKLATVADSRYKKPETLNNEARELKARIAENVEDLLEA